MEAEKAIVGTNLFRKVHTWCLVQEDAEEEAFLRDRVKSRSIKDKSALRVHKNSLSQIEYAPSNPSGWWWKAWSLQILGDYAAALPAAEHALKLAPKNSVYRATCDEIRFLLATSTTPPNASEPGEWRVGDEGLAKSAELLRESRAAKMVYACQVQKIAQLASHGRFEEAQRKFDEASASLDAIEALRMEFLLLNGRTERVCRMKDDDGDLAPGTTARLESLERIRSSQFIESQSLERSLAASPEDP
jgi:tetratricopeptide (TPR) repeat protein